MDATGAYFVSVLIGSVICGVITKAISSSRGHKGGFWWGFWLWIIGIIIVAVRPGDNNVNAVPQTVENPYDQLEKMANLHNSGAITDEEYAKLKAELLNKM